MLMPRYMPLAGQDAQLFCEPRFHYSNTMSGHIRLDASIRPEHATRIVRRRIADQLRDPVSRLRARLNPDGTPTFTYTSESRHRLARRIVRVTPRSKSPLECSHALAEHGLSAIIFVHGTSSDDGTNGTSLYICVTHQFFDGVAVTRLFGWLLDAPILDERMIPSFEYKPGLSELSMLSMIRPLAMPQLGCVMRATATIASNHPRRCLRYDWDWKTHENPRQAPQCDIALSSIRRIKAHLESVRMEKIPFLNLMSILSLLVVWEHTPRPRLHLGVIGACDAPERFNNLMVCVAPMERCNTLWSVQQDSDDTHNLLYRKLLYACGQVSSFMSSVGKSQMLASYLLTNVYDYRGLYMNELIDIVVTCAPSTRPLVFGGKGASLVSAEMYGTSMPLYIGAFTSNDVVHVNMSNRSSDVDLSKASFPTIVDRLLRKCIPCE
jgi:hypothetical protein